MGEVGWGDMGRLRMSIDVRGKMGWGVQRQDGMGCAGWDDTQWGAGWDGVMHCKRVGWDVAWQDALGWDGKR